MRDTGSQGEGFAFFRWRTLSLYYYIVAESRHKLMNCWPILGEWPAEKKRRELRRSASETGDLNE